MQPVFVDVLSIERATLPQPIWLAYGQFVRTFLLPMLAHSQLGWPLQVALTRRDGYEPEEIYSALSWPARLRQPAFSAVTLPSLLANNKKLASSGLVSHSIKDPDLAKQILLKTLKNLLSHMHQVTPHYKTSTWTHYAETASHYSGEDHISKRSFVAAALSSFIPSRVLDVGCNTGVYSVLAADAGAEVVSIDTDLQTVDRLYATLNESGKNILPLCVDLAHPYTLGRVGEPRKRLVPQPLLRPLRYCDDASCDPPPVTAQPGPDGPHRHPVQPPHNEIPHPRMGSAIRRKFANCSAVATHYYTHITESLFREAFAQYFDVIREETLANGRIMLHLLKR